MKLLVNTLFFEYQNNEAHHLSSGEISLLDSIITLIQAELENTNDDYSKKIIVSLLQLPNIIKSYIY